MEQSRKMELGEGNFMDTQNASNQKWQSVVTEFHNKSDRAAAILGAAFLEAHLGRLIAGFFIDKCDETESLLNIERPLGSFSARARAAYCMGLISTNEYHDLGLIMQIQYAFANQISEVTFSDSGIRDKCFALRIPRDVLFPGETHSPRQLFVFASAILTQHLVYRVEIAAKKRCEVPEDFSLVDVDE